MLKEARLGGLETADNVMVSPKAHVPNAMTFIMLTAYNSFKSVKTTFISTIQKAECMDNNCKFSGRKKRSRKGL